VIVRREGSRNARRPAVLFHRSIASAVPTHPGQNEEGTVEETRLPDRPDRGGEYVPPRTTKKSTFGPKSSLADREPIEVIVCSLAAPRGRQCQPGSAQGEDAGYQRQSHRHRVLEPTHRQDYVRGTFSSILQIESFRLSSTPRYSTRSSLSISNGMSGVRTSCPSMRRTTGLLLPWAKPTS
jgi:hypothetical protein